MKGGYDPAHFANLFAVEDRHFWFRARNRVLARLAAQSAAEFGSGCRILEVGCGDGNVLRFLEKACPGGAVIGMDYFAEGLLLARQRVACPLVQGDLAKPPFGSMFHVAGLFDVLEHMPDDLGVLRDLRRMLIERGKLLITVPADPALWSDFDEASGHCRRYQPVELTTKLKEAGFTVEYLSPYMSILYPLMRLSRRKRGGGESATNQAVNRDLRIVPVVNELLLAFLTAEAWWIGRGGKLPIGGSLLAVARKL